MSLSVQSPFPDYAWPRVWQWIQPFRGRVTDDFSPASVEEFVRLQVDRADQRQTWGVWRDGELGGYISIEHLNPVLVQSHVLFKKDFWGRDTTEASIRQVYDIVFASGVLKIASLVYASNHAIRALAQSLGAREEGRLLKHTLRNGVPVDMIALGLTQEDYTHGRSSFGRNHDRRLRCVGGRERQKQDNKAVLHGGPEVGTDEAGGCVRARSVQSSLDLAA